VPEERFFNESVIAFREFSTDAILLMPALQAGAGFFIFDQTFLRGIDCFSAGFLTM
jgi:hypothetical protein